MSADVPLWRRILSRALRREIDAARNRDIEASLSLLSRDELNELQRVYDARPESQEALADMAGRPLFEAEIRRLKETLREQSAQFAEALAAFEERRRCRRLCCPAVAPHDRTHPLCVVRPVLWQDDGDQA